MNGGDMDYLFVGYPGISNRLVVGENDWYH